MHAGAERGGGHAVGGGGATELADGVTTRQHHQRSLGPLSPKTKMASLAVSPVAAPPTSNYRYFERERERSERERGAGGARRGFEHASSLSFERLCDSAIKGKPKTLALNPKP